MKIQNQKVRRIPSEEYLEIYNAIDASINIAFDDIEREIEECESKVQQIARADQNENVGMECVQAYVSNISTFTSLDELDYFDGFTLVENVLESTENEWTAPKWAKAGDVVFFMHSKTARTSITRLRSELITNKDKYDIETYNKLMNYLAHALEVHSEYGGKIFAIGRICGGPEYVSTEETVARLFHWKSRNYSAIDNIITLNKPIDISEFRDYIYISRGSATTALFDNEFVKLREMISHTTTLPSYVADATAKPLPLREINKHNWITVANDYRRCFILEKQFRKFYVDYLLAELGDQRKFYEECRCQRTDINDSFMDYVIMFNHKYLPVEVKLSVLAEPNIKHQVSKYVYNTKVFLTVDGKKTTSAEKFNSGKVLIIDTDSVYLYDSTTDLVSNIFSLDTLTCKNDIVVLRNIIAEKL